MKPGLILSAALIFSSPVPAQNAESPHTSGPNGLEAWTLSTSLPDETPDSAPATLVVARHGTVLHRLEGDPFVWRWMFLHHGRQIAYESGPLHFSMQCILVDVRSGKRIASANCFGQLPPGAPAWVRQLEAQP